MEEGTGQESRGQKSAGEKGHGQEGDKKGHEENRGKKAGREKDRVQEGRTTETRSNQRRRPVLTHPCKSGLSRAILSELDRSARGTSRHSPNAHATRRPTPPTPT